MNAFLVYVLLLKAIGTSFAGMGSLTQIQQDGQATSDDVATLSSQVTALKKCVNTALDSIAQAGQTGKPVAVTKC